jgi:hypothetical protein
MNFDDKSIEIFIAECNEICESCESSERIEKFINFNIFT